VTIKDMIHSKRKYLTDIDIDCSESSLLSYRFAIPIVEEDRQSCEIPVLY